MADTIVNKEQVIATLKEQLAKAEAAIPEINLASQAFPNRQDLKDQQARANDLINQIKHALATYQAA